MTNLYNNNVMITQEQMQEYTQFRELANLTNEYALTDEGKEVYDTHYKTYLDYLAIYKSNKENPGNKKINNDVAELKNEFSELKNLIISKLGGV
jgi:hypothetical protein